MGGLDARIPGADANQDGNINLLLTKKKSSIILLIHMKKVVA